MERIIYISTARTPIDHAMVADILGRSRLNNQRDGLTGLLIVGGRRFLQVIEGPRRMLDLTYRRITADPRHFALVEIERKPISERCFPEWDMGYTEAGEPSLESLGDLVHRQTEAVDDAALKAHLRSFAQLHSKAA